MSKNACTLELDTPGFNTLTPYLFSPIYDLVCNMGVKILPEGIRDLRSVQKTAGMVSGPQ